jgi:hypothetical protein
MTGTSVVPARCVGGYCLLMVERLPVAGAASPSIIN